MPFDSDPIHTIIPGFEKNPDAVFQCQFQMRARYIAPSDIVAKDATTGEILFFLPAGEWLTEDKSITAPDGHSLDVLTPALGTKYEIAPE